SCHGRNLPAPGAFCYLYPRTGLFAVPWDRSRSALRRDAELSGHPDQLGDRAGMHLFHDVGAMERPDVRGFRSEASLDGHGPLRIAACAAERRDAATVSQHDGEVGGDAFLSRCARSITLGDETDKDCVAMSRLN